MNLLSPFSVRCTVTARSCCLLLAACWWLVSSAAARDSLHLACVGTVDLGQGKQKFALTYDDGRAGKMGDKRRIIVILSLQNGNRLGVSDGVYDEEPGRVVLRNPEDKDDVLFRGTVRLVDNGENLQVDGDFTDQDKKAHHLRAKLEGYEVAGIWYGQNLKP